MSGKPRNAPEEIAKMLSLYPGVKKKDAAARFGYTPAMFNYFEKKVDDLTPPKELNEWV